MASSEKPDFIETDEKDAPVKLTTGAEPDVHANSAAQNSIEKPAADVASALRGLLSSPDDSSQKRRQVHVENDPATPRYRTGATDAPPLPKQPIRTGKSMRKLPGGTFVFLAVLLFVCKFGNQLDEFRNRTLTNLAAGFAIGAPGFVETACDLANSYRAHNNPKAAKAAFEEAIATLAAKGEDKGAQGAFLRLRLANLAIAREQIAEAKTLVRQALDMIGKGGSYIPYETPFELYDLGQEFDNYWDYDQGLALNMQAEALWPNNRPNGRSSVKADMGFELNRLGQYQKAEDWLKQALSQTMKQGITGYNAWRLQQLGQAQLGLKKYMEAEVNLNRALEMNEALDNKGRNLKIAETLIDLGKLKTSKGEMALAQSYLERSAVILREQKEYGFFYLQNQWALANLYRDNGQFKKARSIYIEVIGRLISGDHGPNLRDVKRDFDILLAQTGGN